MLGRIVRCYHQIVSTENIIGMSASDTQAGRRPKSASCSGFGLSRLVSRRWTHGDELERSALGPRSVVVHLIGDIVDDAARADGDGVVLIELRPRADQESSGQDRDESLVGMRVRMASIVGNSIGSLQVLYM